MRKLGILAVLLVAAGAAWFTRAHWAGGSQGDEVETSPIRSGSLHMTVQTTGPLKPIETVPVGSEVSGTMDWVGADYNDHVTAGQVIAKLRPELFEAEKRAAAAAKKNADAALKKADLALADLKKRLPM